jgi:hypothetical protein
VLANDSSLLAYNPVVIYSLLALYGVVTIVVVAFVHTKFRFATKILNSLKTEWDSAETLHAGFVGAAQQQISKLAAPAPQAAFIPKPAVNLDMRNQVVSMGKKGFPTLEIAKACNLPEGEVEVLLGMARLLR